MTPGKSYRRGVLDKSTNIVQFGGPKSRPENIFTAIAVHIPPTKQLVPKETNDWLLPRDRFVEKLMENEYAVVKDGECIGIMYPEDGEHKSNLYEYAVIPFHIINHLLETGVI